MEARVNSRGLIVVLALSLAALACGAAAGSEQRTDGSTDGERVFARSGCTACHEDGAGAIAPTLVGLYGSVVTLEDGETRVADEAYLRESILDAGATMVAGYKPIMPDFEGRLSDAEVDALIAYVVSLEG
jgi:cytochrome c oxidase subunit 2